MRHVLLGFSIETLHSFAIARSALPHHSFYSWSGDVELCPTMLSFVWRTRRPGVGYQPSTANPLHAHRPGLCDLTDMLEKTQVRCRPSMISAPEVAC